MANNLKPEDIVSIFNTYRADINSAIKKWTIMKDRFALQDKLYKSLWELSFLDMQNNEYINRLVFGIRDNTFLMIKSIESQIEDVFANKTDKTITQISKERKDYIDGLEDTQQQKYRHLMTDPLFALLIGSTYEPQWDAFRIVNESHLAYSLIKSKEKQEKIAEIMHILSDYRKEISQSKGETDNRSKQDKITTIVNKYADLLQSTWVFALILWKSEQFIGQALFNNRDFKEQDLMKWINYKDDPVFWLLIGDVRKEYIDKKIFDDHKVAKTLVEFSGQYDLKEYLKKLIYFDILHQYRLDCGNIINAKLTNEEQKDAFLKLHASLQNELLNIDPRNTPDYLKQTLGKYKEESDLDDIKQDVLYRVLEDTIPTIPFDDLKKNIIDLHDFIGMLLSQE